MKKKLILLFLFLGMTQAVKGEFSVRVCLADGNTPLLYNEVMVGTKLTLIVSSDTIVTNDYYYDMVIERPDWDRGVLDEGSLLAAAHPDAFICFLHDDDAGQDGFEYSGLGNIGDWFLVDYNALQEGNCTVKLYENYFDNPVPIHESTFVHVPTRDFDNSKIVDFVDFTTFASYWQEQNCQGDCEKVNFHNTDSKIDIDDLVMFCDYWLEETE